MSNLEIESAPCDCYCVRCGEDFPGVRTTIGSREIRTQFCDECVRIMDRTPQEEPKAPTSVEEYLEAAGVNVREYGRTSLETFDASDAPAALEAARDFVLEVEAADRYDPVRGLIYCGPTGTGKTLLAVGILRELIERGAVDPRRVVFRPVPDLIRDIQDTYGTGGTAALLRELERAEVLVLDDLGDEKASPDALRIIRGLVNARSGWPTVVTSNHLPGELGDRHDGDPGWIRLASRLGTRNFRTVRVTGPDRRFQRRGP